MIYCFVVFRSFYMFNPNIYIHIHKGIGKAGDGGWGGNNGRNFPWF